MSDMSSGASPSPPDSSLDEATEEGFILASINTLLGRVGISAKPINSFEELRKSASSMFVAIFEAMFQVRQKGVVRKPAHVHNYVHNAQMVIDALASPILNMDLSHITGEAIVRGDTVAIRNLVDIFMGISEVVLKRQARPDNEPAPNKLWVGSRRRLKARQGQHQRVQHHQAQQPSRASAALPTRMRSKRSVQSTILPPPKTRGAGTPRGRRTQAFAHNRQAPQLVPRNIDIESRMDEEEKRGPVMGESEGGDDPGSFVQELLVSPGSESVGQKLTAQNILEAHGMLDERDYEVEGPLREADLERVPGMTRQEMKREEDREMKYRLFYQRVLKERLVALRKRELADARKQHFAHNNAKHLARVRQLLSIVLGNRKEDCDTLLLAMAARVDWRRADGIKKERMQEKLRLGRMLQQTRQQQEGQYRINHLHKKILTALHRQRREDDREDAARLKALHLAWQGQGDDMENFFNERVGMIMEHEQTSARERAQAMASEEHNLLQLFRQAEKDYEARLSNQLQREAMEDAAHQVQKAEVYRACSELLGLEDWSCASRDRFLSARSNSAFERRLKQVRTSADVARARLNNEKKIRNLNKAYGQHF